MVQVAYTEKQYQKCVEFLQKRDYTLMPYSILLYVEENDELIAVAGYHKDWGSMIEPMYSEESLRGVRASKALYDFFVRFFIKMGHLTIRFKTKNERLVKLMTKHYGFKQQEDLTYMTKEL